MAAAEDMHAEAQEAIEVAEARAEQAEAEVARLRRCLVMAEELLWQAAGMGAGAVMQDAPDVVMPTERIEEGIKPLLTELRTFHLRKRVAEQKGQDDD